MNKNVLITGVAGGIGKATAKAFSDGGWKVIGIDKHNIDVPLNNVCFFKGDISDSSSSKELFKEVGKIVDKLDAIINNAAVQICKPLLKMDIYEWDSVMATNVRSIYLTVRDAYNLMLKPGGAIVNLGSVHAIATSNNIAAYAGSKGAVMSLTRALAIELAKDGIRVNAVLPGAVETEMLLKGINRGDGDGNDIDEKLRRLSRRTPLGRIGKPDEIAQAILFLADFERSSFITGQGLVVDGGALAKLSTE